MGVADFARKTELATSFASYVDNARTHTKDQDTILDNSRGLVHPANRLESSIVEKLKAWRLGSSSRVNTTGEVKLEEPLDRNYEADNGSTMCTKIHTSSSQNPVSINESRLQSADNFFPQTSTPKTHGLSHLEKQDSIISINSLCSNESDWSDE